MSLFRDLLQLILGTLVRFSRTFLVTLILSLVFDWLLSGWQSYPIFVFYISWILKMWICNCKQQENCFLVCLIFLKSKLLLKLEWLLIDILLQVHTIYPLMWINWYAEMLSFMKQRRCLVFKILNFPMSSSLYLNNQTNSFLSNTQKKYLLHLKKTPFFIINRKYIFFHINLLISHVD